MASKTTDTLRLRRDSTAVGGLQLVVLQAGAVATHELPKHGAVVIGRSASCDVRLHDGAVSRRHALLSIDAKVRLEDLGSANGIVMRAEMFAIKGREDIGGAGNRCWMRWRLFGKGELKDLKELAD